MKPHLLFFFFFTILNGSAAVSQTGLNLSHLDANSLSFSYYSNGNSGAYTFGINGSAGRPMVFPTGTGRRYIYGISPVFAAHVANQIGVGSSFPIVIAPYWRTEPITKKPWYLLPSDGFEGLPETGLARRSNPNSWPALWEAEGRFHWPHVFEDRAILSAEELYIRFDDRAYTRYLNRSDFRYRPIMTDSTRGGLGLEVSMRVIALQDGPDHWLGMHLIIYDIKNISDYELESVSFVLEIHDFVGVAQNNIPRWNIQDKSIYFTNGNPNANAPEFGGIPIGVAGIRFMDGMNENAFIIHSLAANSLNWNNSDAVLWQYFGSGSAELIPIDPSLDYSHYIGSTGIRIQSGVTHRVVIALGAVQPGLSSNDEAIEILESQFDLVEMDWSAGMSSLTTRIPDSRGPSNSDYLHTVQLHSNYPNPFNPTTTIRYELPEAMPIRLAVFDALGREVDVLVEGFHPAGTGVVQFDAAHLSSGIYMYRLTAGGQLITKTMLLVK